VKGGGKVGWKRENPIGTVRCIVRSFDKETARPAVAPYRNPVATVSDRRIPECKTGGRRPPLQQEG